MSAKLPRIVLTPEQAKAMLPDGKHIHVFASPAGGILVGADWSREAVEKEIDIGPCELSGPMATSMGHGLAILSQRGPWFVMTKEKVQDAATQN